MDDKRTGRRQSTSLDGWSLAAAFGLMATAFLIERLAPADQNDRPGPASDLPPQSGTKRDASPAHLAVEGEDRGR
jgi:hypothetical protein